MAYLGNSSLPFDPTRSVGAPRDADRFSGNASTVTFTLSRFVQKAVDIEVFVENVQQEPLTAFDVNGTSLTFTGAPPSGTNNVYVVYRNFDSGAQSYVPDGSITYNKLANNIRIFTTDNLTPNGNNSVFTLSEPPADANTVMVTVDGIIQRAPVHYTTSGSTITFTSSPPAGSNVHVRHLGFRTTSTVTAIPAGTTITTPVLSGATGTLSSPTITTPSIVGNVAFSNTNSLVVSNTGGVSIFTVDSIGRPLTPSRPSFMAYKFNAGLTLTGSAWSEINSTTMSQSFEVQHNTNGHFGVSTGRFTAPVAGKYFFTVVSRGSDNAGADKIPSIQFWVNGANQFTDYWGSYAASWSGSYRPTLSCSIILNLNANDYVSIASYMTSSPTIFALSFGGYLIG